MMKRPRQKDEQHLAFVRELPCITCGDNTSTEAAHIRKGSLKAAKRPTGMAEKPDDVWTLPLCGKCHREQHESDEGLFWAVRAIDPIFTALALARVTGDHEAGTQIIENARS